MEFYLGILFGLIAASFLVWALVRPRKGDVPHCRRCGFSLAGLTEPVVCPECGGVLARKRAIAIGEKRHKHRPIAWACGLVVAATTMILLDRASVTGYMPVSEYKPAWLLTGEAYLLDDRRASIATAEIVRRVQLGELSAEHGERLLSIALARHAQTWRSFPDSQWQVITDAISARQLTTAQIRRVFDNIFEDGFVIGYGDDGPTYDPGQSHRIDVGVNYRTGQLARQRALTVSDFSVSDFSVSDFFMFYNIHTTLELHERLDMMQNAGSRLVHSTGLRRSLAAAGQPRVDSQDYVAVYTPWIDGVYTGTVGFRVDIHRLLDLASDAKVRKRGPPFEYAVCEIPIEFEVVSTEKHRFPVLDIASLPGEASSYVELTTKLRYGYKESRSPQDQRYFIELKQDAGIDWQEVAMAGHIVLRQGDRVVRHNFSQWLNERTRIELSLPSLVFVGEYEPGEIQVTYEHNEAVAAWMYRQDHYKFERILGGPIELGTITIPEPNQAE